MDMVTALAHPDQPRTTFKALEDRVNAVVGVKLFTLLTLDHGRALAQRSYSNMPDAYPESGSKPMIHGDWADQVITGKRIFVANTIQEIEAVFADHALIQSLGCESCINIPVTVGGSVIGTLNCLHEAGHYTPDRVAQAETLKEPGALAFLLARSMTEAS